jgi:hypothetical protein
VKKNVKGKTGDTAGTRGAPQAPSAPPAQATESATKRIAAPRKPATAAKSKRATTSSATPPGRRSPAEPQPAPSAPDGNALRKLVAPGFEAILTQLRSMQQMLERLAAPPPLTDAALETSVDSLRRLLSELIEQRMESVVLDLVDVRREAANLPAQSGERIVERLDQLLEDLGAARFDAEQMDVVDPLIHVVVDERHQPDAPDGVILETRRPGYRTARGTVACKAAVVVNHRL